MSDTSHRPQTLPELIRDIIHSTELLKKDRAYIKENKPAEQSLEQNEDGESFQRIERRLIETEERLRHGLRTFVEHMKHIESYGLIPDDKVSMNDYLQDEIGGVEKLDINAILGDLRHESEDDIKKILSSLQDTFEYLKRYDFSDEDMKLMAKELHERLTSLNESPEEVTLKQES